MENVGNSRVLGRFPATTLYLNDLQDLMRAFQSVCKTVELRAGAFEIVDADELTELAAKFRSGKFGSIRLVGHDPYVSIDLQPIGMQAFVLDDAPVEMGLVAKGREIARRGWKPRAFIVWSLSMVVALSGGLVLLDQRQFVFGGILVCLAIASAVLAVERTARNTVVVRTGNRGDRPGFLRRNGDAIAVAVISALLGALLGGAVMYWVTRLPK
jgi:hypothetical protein